MSDKQGNGSAQTSIRISHSFTSEEIKILDFVTRVLLRGGDPRIARRASGFASLCRKVQVMTQKVEAKRGTPLPPLAVAPEAPAAPASEDDDPSET